MCVRVYFSYSFSFLYERKKRYAPPIYYAYEMYMYIYTHHTFEQHLCSMPSVVQLLHKRLTLTPTSIIFVKLIIISSSFSFSPSQLNCEGELVFGGHARAADDR